MKIPEKCLNCEHTYKPRHPRFAFGGQDAYEGIKIIALPKGDRMPEIVPDRLLKNEEPKSNQITLFDMGGAET